MGHIDVENMIYAHDAHCNVVHRPGPEPCPPYCEHNWLDVTMFGNAGRVGRCFECGSEVVDTSMLPSLRGERE